MRHAMVFFTAALLIAAVMVAFPSLGRAQEHCVLGAGSPVSSSKLIMTTVAHYLDRGDEESMQNMEVLNRQEMFRFSREDAEVEVLIRSGVLVKVRLVGKPDIFWTVNGALSCY